MLADRPYAGDVLAELDRRFTAGPYVLVAHHAPAEARLLFNYRERCPHLARIDLLDTVRLARDLYPELPKHGLDDLLRHLQILSPPHRHRAMATTMRFCRRGCSIKPSRHPCGNSQNTKALAVACLIIMGSIIAAGCCPPRGCQTAPTEPRRLARPTKPADADYPELGGEVR